MLQAQYEAQRRAAEEAERRKREAAQAAYDKNVAAMNNAYNSQLNSLKSNQESTLGVLQSNYDQGVAGVNKQADAANQQAYINYMMSKRDLPQQLTAQGISGGAAESTMAGLYNNYGNSRNTIDSGRNDSLADLLAGYNSDKATAQQNYNSALSNLEAQKASQQMQLEQNLANMIADAETTNYEQQFALSQDYISQMAAVQQAAAEAAQKAASTSYSASNKGKSVSTNQYQEEINNMYQKYLKQQIDLGLTGDAAVNGAKASSRDYIFGMYNGGQIDQATMDMLMAQLGYQVR